MKKLLLCLLCFAAMRSFAQPFALWGMTSSGGTYNAGVLFEYNPSTGISSTKLNFDGTNGQNPQGGLIKASNGKLYGMTREGGPYGLGVLFEYDLSNSSYTKKLDFNGTNGQYPSGDLFEASNGKLYGMTSEGGSNASGVLFEYDPSSNAYTIKLNFDGSNGASPYGSLRQASNGKLYGLTNFGGASDVGLLFEYDPASDTYLKKHDFDGSNGAYPKGSLLQATNGKLYGMTTEGGVNAAGVLFEFDPATDTYLNKFDFDGTTGANPFGTLAEASNSNLYGMTFSGGSNGVGVLFEYNPATSTYTQKLDFDYSNGASPYGSLSLAPNGKLYAMTNQGGAYYIGNLFEFDPAGDTYTNRLNFNYTNGQNPYYSSLLVVLKDKVLIPDDNFETYLEANGMGDGIANNNYVLWANISTVTNLEVSGNNIADLTGIADFIALETLDCSNNDLTALNLRHNTVLETLDCSNNSLTSLTISSNTVLTSLLCNDNQLSSLDVNNNNNSNFTDFNSTNNPYLFCVRVDDPAYSSANWTQKDAHTGFGNGCNNIVLLPNINIDPILPLITGTTYSISAVLPAGLNFNTSTGIITGTPTTAGPPAYYIITIDGTQTFSFTLTVKEITTIPARYVQYRGSYSDDAGQVNIYELAVYSDGKNVAFNKPGSSNSYEGGGDWSSNGTYAVDGCTATRYSSDRSNPVTSVNDPVVLTVNLSEEEGFIIDNISVFSAGWTQDFNLYISEDNENWIKYAEVSQSPWIWASDQGIDPSYSGSTITSFNPASGAAGTEVTITGSNLSFATRVTFGGVEATSFKVNSSTEITAIIGEGTPPGEAIIMVSDLCNNIQGTSNTGVAVHTILYVNDDAGGANNGSTWGDAFTDLQSAIDAAQAGDTIFVAAGTYQPATSGQSFGMKEAVKVYGGFAGTETAISERDLTTNISILTGNGNSVIRNDNNGLTPAAVLDGFTISGGNANNSTGGGMMNANASPTVINCTFSGNSADGGGYGGGMYNGNNSFPIITNCIFSGNSADYGGGMYNDLSGPAITNCTFSGNNATTDGGTMYNNNFSLPFISNTIMWGNSSGITDIASSAATISYSLAEGLNTGTGNLDTDPQFISPVSAASAPTTTGDYHLQSCSPAINAGYNIAYVTGQPVDLSAVTTDITGSLRRQLGRVDIGAYESIADESTASIVDDNIVVTNIQAADTITYYGNECNELIAAVAGNNIDPVNGNTTVKVWIETVQPATYVKRHYEITPGNGTTGRITLYFTQDEFDDFNDVIGNRLPQSPVDNAGKANIRIEKLDGVSSDNTGLPGTYPANPPVDIPNNALQIDWNATANRWEISFDVTGFSGFFVKAIVGTLPLCLLNFEAKKKDCMTTVNWTTEEEINVAGFEVQQSTDGVSFSTIKTVNARNTAGQNNYSITVPVIGNKLFYRLKMTDIDGKVKYSEVAFITTDCSNSLLVYPNPATDKIFIRGAAIGKDYSVYDNAGRKVAGGRIDKNVKEINVTGMIPGVFYVMVDGKSYKIIKN